MTDLLCPFGDGRHKRRPWHDAEGGRSGLSCVRCHKTWRFNEDRELVPTWTQAMITAAKCGA